MSAYEDYDEVSDSFALWRRPLGAPIIAAYLRDLLGEKAYVLDVGCGSGHYALYLKSLGMTVEGVDLNHAQIRNARIKAREENLGVLFEIGDALNLNFQDAQFDGVLLNMVLHHLDWDKGAENAHIALHEASRVVRDSGVVIIGTVSHEQARLGAWYYSLCPELSERFVKKLPSENDLILSCEKEGLKLIEKVVPHVGVFRPESYFSADGILDFSKRAASSLFSLLEESEMKSLIDSISALESTGELEDFIGEHDKVRQGCGQITLYILQKTVR